MDTNRFSDAFVTAMTAAYIDLPAAAAQSLMTGDRAPLRAAGWAAYDALVDLANEWADQLYRNALFARFFSISFEISFIMEQLLEGRSVLDSRPIKPYVEIEPVKIYANGHDRTRSALHPIDWHGATRPRRPLNH